MDHFLRYVMVAVLDVDAIKTEKFTNWNTRQCVLGFEHGPEAGLVSFPETKIIKARRIVGSAYNTKSPSRKEYRLLMGILHHVVTCIRAARPFLQRLRQRESHLCLFQNVPIVEKMNEDLLWRWMILRTSQLSDVSLEFFNTLPSSDVVIETVTSNFGLCALDHSAQAALTHEFTPFERHLILAFYRGVSNGFDINFRELLSCAYVAHGWGLQRSQRSSHIKLLHVHFRIGTSSAVAWQNKLASRILRAQAIIRFLSRWVSPFRLRFSASHIPGVDNVRANAVSRISANCRLVRFTNAWLVTGLSDAGLPRSNQYLAAYFCARSVTNSTFDQYKRALSKWQIWTSRRGFSPWTDGMPLIGHVQHISDFVLHGFQVGYGSSGPFVAKLSWWSFKTFVTSSTQWASDFQFHTHAPVFYPKESTGWTHYVFERNSSHWSFSTHASESCIWLIPSSKLFGGKGGDPVSAVLLSIETFQDCGDQQRLVQVVCPKSTRHCEGRCTRYQNSCSGRGQFGMDSSGGIKNKSKRQSNYKSAFAVGASIPVSCLWDSYSAPSEKRSSRRHPGRSVHVTSRQTRGNIDCRFLQGHRTGCWAYRKRPTPFQLSILTPWRCHAHVSLRNRRTDDPVSWSLGSICWSLQKLSLM